MAKGREAVKEMMGEFREAFPDHQLFKPSSGQ
jgi:hypothetical protein